MLAFDLAEKNKREAVVQYIKLLNQKNPESIVQEGNELLKNVRQKKYKLFRSFAFVY